MAAMTMSSRAAAGGERRLHRVSYCGDLPRPIRPVPGVAAPRPGTPRPPGFPAGGAAPPSARAESNWWGAGARQAAAVAPRRQRSCKGVARVPTGKGNRELVRRALAPPAVRGRGRGGPVLIRRWSFRPAPSPLRNASSSPSPVSPRPRPL